MSDQGGLVKFGIRWYLPGVGAWMQEDTLDSPLDPNNANRYAYAGDNPISNSDLAGMLTTEDESSIWGAAATGLGIASVVATAKGVGAPIALDLGVASTAASVGSRAVVGDTSGAVGAGLLGGATLELGGLGEALPIAAKTGAATEYGAIEVGTSYLSN